MGVVVHSPWPVHALQDAGGCQDLPELRGQELGAAVAVEDRARIRPAATERGSQCSRRQRRRAFGAQCPAEKPPAIAVAR